MMIMIMMTMLMRRRGMKTAAELFWNQHQMRTEFPWDQKSKRIELENQDNEMECKLCYHPSQMQRKRRQCEKSRPRMSVR